MDCNEKDKLLSNFDIQKDFSKLIVIDKDEKSLQESIYGKNSFGYYLIDEKGKINIYKSYKENCIQTFVIDKNGLLIGVDHGEWGGGLIFKYLDLFFQNNIEEVILNKNVQFIFKLNNDILVLSGLSHLMTNFGNLYFLEYDKDYGKINIKNNIEFNSMPLAYTIHNNKIYIVTLRSMLIINNGKIEYEFKFDGWFLFYFTSIYVKDDEVIIGAEGFLMIINTKLNEYKLYKINHKE